MRGCAAGSVVHFEPPACPTKTTRVHVSGRLVSLTPAAPGFRISPLCCPSCTQIVVQQCNINYAPTTPVLTATATCGASSIGVTASSTDANGHALSYQFVLTNSLGATVSTQVRAAYNQSCVTNRAQQYGT